MRPVHVFAVVLLLQGCGALSLPEDRAPGASQAAASSRVPEPLLLRAADGTLCNAVRIAPARAATAAHCLEAVGPFVLEAEFGALPVLGTRTNPAYALLDPAISAAADLAVLRLSPDMGGTVAIASIRPGPAVIHARTPSGARASRTCNFLGRAGGLVELECSVPLGWSGAPVLQDGMLVGIVSSRGRGVTSGITQMAEAVRINSF